MRRYLKKFGAVLFITVMTTMLVMCTPTGVDMLGDAMVDAGNLLRDSASDATSDAMAQDSCASSCTGSGVQRVMTADTDPAQLRGETLTLPSRSAPFTGVRVASGPFVLTDALLSSYVTTSSYTSVQLSIAADCTLPATERTAVGEVRWSGGTGVPFSSSLQGVRIHVPAGSLLCAYSPEGGAILRYAGFTPYE